MPSCIWVLTTVRVQSAKGDELRQRNHFSAVLLRVRRNFSTSTVRYVPGRKLCANGLAIDRSLWRAETVIHVSGMNRCLLAPRIRQIRALDGARGPSVNGLLLTASRV